MTAKRRKTTKKHKITTKRQMTTKKHKNDYKKDKTLAIKTQNDYSVGHFND